MTHIQAVYRFIGGAVPYAHRTSIGLSRTFQGPWYDKDTAECKKAKSKCASPLNIWTLHCRHDPYSELHPSSKRSRRCVASSMFETVYTVYTGKQQQSERQEQERAQSLLFGHINAPYPIDPVPERACQEQPSTPS